ncbi:MAG: radical SAM protein [Parasporobacterium sp.]|nr:radical SAM protein [Parasporobacterium sp.]
MERYTDHYSNCILCPRNCGANRNISAGYCRSGRNIRAARAGLHYYEEPYLSGINGSGTVFFSGCSLGCIYCQNMQITHENFGFEISPERLSDIFLEQQKRNAHNINLVTGTHFTPSIAEALRIAKDSGLSIPVVWNSSGYEKPDTLRMLTGLVDIFLPDFKTLSSELGQRYMNAPDYPGYAKEALACMVELAGEPVFEPYDFTVRSGSDKTGYGIAEGEDPDDLMEGEGVLLKKGVVVRHLIIPDQAEDSKNVVKYLHETYGSRIWLSLMSQYTPVGVFDVSGDASACTSHKENSSPDKYRQPTKTAGPEACRLRSEFPELTGVLSSSEYDEVLDYAIELGVENCMIQDVETASESFIPVFDGTGILS